MTNLVNTPAVVRRAVGVVRVTGDDRVSYLHTLLSQHLESAKPGDAADFLYLEPKGNAVAAGRALVRTDEVLLLSAPEVAPALAEKLDAMRFMLRVEVADVSGEWALASVRGDEDVPVEAMSFDDQEQGLMITDRSGGRDLLGSPEWLEVRLAELGLPEADETDWDAWRITHGVVAWGRELVPGHRAQELGVLPTHVHLKKGCYPGQESIAKTWNLGHPRRALATVELDAQPGDTVRVGEHDARVTSAAPQGDHWIALALIPVDADGTLPTTTDDPSGRIVRKVGDGLPIPGA